MCPQLKLCKRLLLNESLLEPALALLLHLLVNLLDRARQLVRGVSLTFAFAT